ncbi:hypothetical protein Bca52824_023057 [Brassica carinata]|uniref:Uncharacterized protein n=1 Tax=Brassica carinata TaxID=52824 RepID=A0A8X8ASJ3_BRACI|nr:hypothetical protein Bca52824_023057 [Brassica carinata]
MPRPRPPRREGAPKFVSLIDGMISDCGLEIECLTKDLADRGGIETNEATLKSAEGAHAAGGFAAGDPIGDLEAISESRQVHCLR